MEEDPDLLLAFDLADAVAGFDEPEIPPDGRDSMPAAPPQPPPSKSVVSPDVPVLSDAIVVEPYSKLRVTRWEYPPAELSVLLAGRIIHTLREIAKAGDASKFTPKDPRACAEWATIGVLSRKSETKLSASDSKYQSWQLTDFSVGCLFQRPPTLLRMYT